MAFGNLNGDEDERKELAEINIIPLVDVMLVLLIIFMVAAPLSISGLKVNLPQSAAKGAKVDGKKVILTISQEGDFYFEKVRIPQDSLSTKLGAIFANKEKKQLYIRADRSVAYGKVVDAMSAAKIAGVEKMSMLTVPPRR